MNLPKNKTPNSNSVNKVDNNKLLVFNEGRKRRTYVGRLSYEPSNGKFIFEYDDKYLRARSSIPLGPELELTKKRHVSKANKLFPTFVDRIPSRTNPAYPEYCESQNSSVDETNPIVLLRSIGRRGPSTFVFEKEHLNTDEDTVADLKRLRQELSLSIADVAHAFDLTELSVNNIETGKSRDRNILKLITIFLKFPDVALWQLERSGKKLHGKTLQRLRNYFEGKS